MSQTRLKAVGALCTGMTGFVPRPLCVKRCRKDVSVRIKVIVIIVCSRVNEVTEGVCVCGVSSLRFTCVLFFPFLFSFFLLISTSDSLFVC